MHVVTEADPDEHARSSRWHRPLQYDAACSCTRVTRHQDGTRYAFRSLIHVQTLSQEAGNVSISARSSVCRISPKVLNGLW